jgi:hypothetical protein
VSQPIAGALALLAFAAAIAWALFYERGDMARMLRKTREFRMLGKCGCCSPDVNRFKRSWRRQMRKRARRAEERRWLREARTDD